ncbi:cAMP-binding protein [Stutzerimonas stutzeri]|uniref:cAMP-binding protein n=1 Tax=Stutzerimonas stutzeri TaxID=316 RepID=A0A2N8T541_STUST|nr:cyclic nucleotide-binding domain-containing protein [Stutzerimonas stutzeri]MCQ4325245.1 cyclic nucleotide-binding domain-containing protein [Stutzerimonas stutzeri]PNG09860.1 cAMP-binding protein [Stutzerimonas stutzeri]
MNNPLHPDQLRNLIPLNTLSPRQLWELRARLAPQPLAAGQVLECAGAQPSARYFLLSGSLALVDDEGHESRLRAGTPAGCHSLPQFRLQHVRALEDCRLLAVDNSELERLLSWRQAHQDVLLQLSMDGELGDWLESLLDNPLFAQVPPANIRSMLQRLVAVELCAGQPLLQEGEAGDCCYFLKSGRAAVTKGTGAERQLLAELEPGACFGEEALLEDRPRNASVSMLEDGCVLRLARADFLELLKAPVVSEVGLDEVADLLSCGAQWLDVRLLDEYERGHAMQALNMPLHLLRLKTRLLDHARIYLCYCESGKGSANAVFLLTQLGFTAYALRGGLQALSAEERDALLWECGTGYLARSDGRIERSL